MRQKTKYALSILLSILFIQFLGISLVIPVMPTIMNELHLSGTIVGYLVAAFALAQLLFSPIAGRWTDKFGRKKMLIVGLFIFGISEYLFGIGKTDTVLFISRILGGFSAACNMPAVNAYIADITTEKERPKAIGYMSAAMNTGFIVGPGIGGFIAEFGHRIPFFVAAVMAFIAMLLSIIILVEPERNMENVSIHIEKEKTRISRIFSPMYFISFMIILIFSFGLASFDSLFSLFTDHKFGFTPKDISIMITGGAIVGVIAQVALFDRFVQWLGEIRFIRCCLIFSTVLVFLMTVVSSYMTILLVTFTVFVGFDLMRPAVTNYLTKIAGDEQGFVAGMNSMFTSLGNVFGPIVGGALFDFDINYPFYFSTIVLILGTVLTLFWKEPEHEKA